MRRVVVTGLGIVSPIGIGADAVTESLRSGRSGIRFRPQYADMGLASQVAGAIGEELREQVPRRQRRFMGDASMWAYLAAEQAIADAGLEPAAVSHPRTGLIAASGGASTANVVESADVLRDRGLRRVGPYRVPRTMSSTVAACLSTAFGIQGVSYSVTSACATSAHCIGVAMEQIQLGKQDVVLAGGGEEEHWTLALLFDAMGALSRGYNAQPEAASRPYDQARDGFVIAGGGGMVVVEALEHARARGAPIYGEIVGYAATCDGADMVAPNADGQARCMRLALGELAQTPDYLNAHGTGTALGDVTELQALRAVFGDQPPPISATKALTGHSLGAAGVQEAIYCLLMMRHDFIAASANIEHLDAAAKDFPIVRETRPARLGTVMSNSFGFGGTNASLVFARCD